MDADVRARLAELAAAATSWPWKITVHANVLPDESLRSFEFVVPTLADAEFIVACREAVPRLLADLQERDDALLRAADALHDAAWVISGEAKAEYPLPHPRDLVLPQTRQAEADLRALAAVPVPPAEGKS